jgi:hypothetical protein
MRAQRARSYLFTLRFWPEETTGGHIEWRGKLQQVTSGETIYFRDWDALVEFLESALDSDTHPDGQGIGSGGGGRQGEEIAHAAPAEQGRDEDEANA